MHRGNLRPDGGCRAAELLLAARGRLRILEPFCGNGRILIPLAEDGQTLAGLDESEPMLHSAQKKLDLLPSSVR